MLLKFDIQLQREEHTKLMSKQMTELNWLNCLGFELGVSVAKTAERLH